MAKLSNYMIDDLTKEILSPFKKEHEKAEKSLVEEFQKLHDAALPACVKETLKKYPSALSKSGSLNLYGVPKEITGRDRSFYVYGGLFVDGSDKWSPKEIYLHMDETQKEHIHLLIGNIVTANKKYEDTRKKLGCVFGDLNTPAKLKNGFPEAYAIYLRLTGENPGGLNHCDAVEEVRANFNKLTDVK